MLSAKRRRNRERRPFARLAFNRDRAAMHFHKLTYQCETDPSPFMAASLYTIDPLEALKEMSLVGLTIYVFSLGGWFATTRMSDVM